MYGIYHTHVHTQNIVDHVISELRRYFHILCLVDKANQGNPALPSCILCFFMVVNFTTLLYITMQLFRCINSRKDKQFIASHDSSKDYTIISTKKADFIGNAWLHIHNRKGFHFSAN